MLFSLASLEGEWDEHLLFWSRARLVFSSPSAPQCWQSWVCGSCSSHGLPFTSGPASPSSPRVGATGHTSGPALKATYIYIFVAVFVREGNGTPLQYSCLENPMNGGAARSQTRLSDFTFTFHFHALEKGNSLQCSCLENPRDGGAWWASVYRIAQSWTWLKQLSSSTLIY